MTQCLVKENDNLVLKDYCSISIRVHIDAFRAFWAPSRERGRKYGQFLPRRKPHCLAVTTFGCHPSKTEGVVSETTMHYVKKSHTLNMFRAMTMIAGFAPYKYGVLLIN